MLNGHDTTFGKYFFRIIVYELAINENVYAMIAYACTLGRHFFFFSGFYLCNFREAGYLDTGTVDFYFIGVHGSVCHHYLRSFNATWLANANLFVKHKAIS